MITTENLFEPNHRVTSVWATYGLFLPMGQEPSWVQLAEAKGAAVQNEALWAVGTIKGEYFFGKKSVGRAGSEPGHQPTEPLFMLSSPQPRAKCQTHDKWKPTNMGGRGHSPSDTMPLKTCLMHREDKDWIRKSLFSQSFFIQMCHCTSYSTLGK